MQLLTIRADQLRRGHRIIRDHRGKETVYLVEWVERGPFGVRYFARPIGRRGRPYDGRIHREIEPYETIDVVKG